VVRTSGNKCLSYNFHRWRSNQTTIGSFDIGANFAAKLDTSDTQGLCNKHISMLIYDDFNKLECLPFSEIFFLMP
jgi:hypothetical protein